MSEKRNKKSRKTLILRDLSYFESFLSLEFCGETGWLMGVDTPVGYTLPDMVLTVVLCVLAEKLRPTKAEA